jgi:hypothetical protein
MWVGAPPLRANDGDLPSGCPRCGGELRNVGSPSLAARYLRCEACNHLVVVPPKARV